jgi:Sec-independent protein translocase protein TatA
MGFAMSVPQLLIVIGLIALIFGTERFTGMADGVRSQLHK